MEKILLPFMYSPICNTAAVVSFMSCSVRLQTLVNYLIKYQSRCGFGSYFVDIIKIYYQLNLREGDYPQ